MVKRAKIAFEEIKSRLIRLPVLHYLIVQADSTCTWTQVNLLWEAHYIKYRMESQN